MRMIRNILIVLACLSFTGCTKIIDLESLRPDPVLVVNCIALTDEPLKASVSRSWFLMEDRPNVTLDKANVRLFVNDAFVSRMAYEKAQGEGYNSRGVFCSNYYPKVGDRVRIEVSEPEYGEAYAEAVVPRPANILSATQRTTVDNSAGWYASLTHAYTVTFRDNASTEDYYLFRLESGHPVYDEEKELYTGQYDWNHIYLDYSEDPLFGQSIASIDQVLGYNWLSGSRGRTFSDELINGQEYTIRLMTEGVNPFPSDTSSTAPNNRLRALLYTVSKDYYLYLKTLQDQSDGTLSNILINAGLAEPIRVYSNVEGGVGIVGACRRDTLEIEVKK